MVMHELPRDQVKQTIRQLFLPFLGHVKIAAILAGVRKESSRDFLLHHVA
jgi:hypothetical protein